MRARDGGPAAVAYLTALLGGDAVTANQIIDELDKAAVRVAFAGLAGGIYGMLQAISLTTDEPFSVVRDRLLESIGMAVAGWEES